MARRRIRYPTGVRPAPPGPDGSPRWVLRWKVGGRERTRTFQCDTPQEAAEERGRLIAGRAEPVGARGGPQIRRCVDEFLRSRQTHATAIQDRGNLARLVESFDGRHIGSITTPELRAWLEDVRARDGQPYSVNSRKALKRSAGSLWAWAADRGYVQRNVVTEIRVRKPVPRGPAPAPPKRHLTLEELRALFAWLGEEHHAHPTHAMIFRYQFRLGLRVGEACCLRRELIDWDTGVVTIDRAISHGLMSSTKIKRQSQKWLSEAGRAELRPWLDEHDDRGTGYCFVKPQRLGDRWPVYQPSAVGVTFRAALDALGGCDLDRHTTTHALRHSWYEIARSFEFALTDQDIASVLGNTPEIARKAYASGPGLMARRIAEHLETAVFRYAAP